MVQTIATEEPLEEKITQIEIEKEDCTSQKDEVELVNTLDDGAKAENLFPRNSPIIFIEEGDQTPDRVADEKEEQQLAPLATQDSSMREDGRDGNFLIG